jgi:hypothetical protein
MLSRTLLVVSMMIFGMHQKAFASSCDAVNAGAFNEAIPRNYWSQNFVDTKTVTNFAIGDTITFYLALPGGTSLWYLYGAGFHVALKGPTHRWGTMKYTVKGTNGDTNLQSTLSIGPDWLGSVIATCRSATRR